MLKKTKVGEFALLGSNTNYKPAAIITACYLRRDGHINPWNG
jgi:hypothetical protein